MGGLHLFKVLLDPVNQKPVILFVDKECLYECLRRRQHPRFH